MKWRILRRKGTEEYKSTRDKWIKTRNNIE